MYILKPGIKQNPQRRWALPDRIFFGHGACHILAGTFLEAPPLAGFFAERIIPTEGFSGNHVYVTNGAIAFDHHGYSCRRRLLRHHRKGWASHSPGWDCVVERADFDLLDTAELNKRKMLGPDQYLHDPVPRARRFIARIDHAKSVLRALAHDEEMRGGSASPHPTGTLRWSLGERCRPAMDFHIKQHVS